MPLALCQETPTYTGDVGRTAGEDAPALGSPQKHQSNRWSVEPSFVGARKVISGFQQPGERPAEQSHLRGRMEALWLLPRS